MWIEIGVAKRNLCENGAQKRDPMPGSMAGIIVIIRSTAKSSVSRWRISLISLEGVGHGRDADQDPSETRPRSRVGPPWRERGLDRFLMSRWFKYVQVTYGEDGSHSVSALKQ